MTVPPIPRILIIEDQENTRLDLFELFSDPPLDYIKPHLIREFRVDTASTGKEAKTKLQTALCQRAPYDVITLDLGLPRTLDDLPDPKVGCDLLEELSDNLKGATGTVVILSVWAEINYVIDALRAGAADFISKDSYDEHVFFDTVVLAFEKARLKWKNSWEGYKQQRFKQWILVQACAKVADDMAHIVTDGLGEVLGHARQLGRLIDEELMLDSHHPICRHLEKIRGTASAIVRDCAASRDSSNPAPGPIEKFCVSDRLENTLDNLRLGLAYFHSKVAVVKDGDFSVLASARDLDILLEELLSSAIEASESNAYGGGETRTTVKIWIRYGQEAGTVEIECSDQGPPVEEWNNRKIINSEDLDATSERSWRLSLAQRVALNVGARLEIRSTEGNNHVQLILREGQ